MVISDFIIISPKQLIAKLPKKKDVIIETRNRIFFPTIYQDGFSIAQRHLRGIWYTIYPSEDKLYTDPFFDLHIENGLQIVKVQNHWINTVTDIIDFFLEKAPDHKIFVLFRLDYPKNEVFHERQSKEVFLNKMVNGKLCFDEIYSLTK